jgi:hypothetical protein
MFFDNFENLQSNEMPRACPVDRYVRSYKRPAPPHFRFLSRQRRERKR